MGKFAIVCCLSNKLTYGHQLNLLFGPPIFDEFSLTENFSILSDLGAIRHRVLPVEQTNVTSPARRSTGSSSSAVARAAHG